MNAITFKAPGDSNVLELVKIPLPTLQTPYDILVKIQGSALNPVDYKVSQRHHHPQLQLLVIHVRIGFSSWLYSSAKIKVG